MKNYVLTSLTIAFALFSVFIFYNQGITGMVTYDSCPNTITVPVTITDDTPTSGNCGSSNGLDITLGDLTVDCQGNYILGGGVGLFATGVSIASSKTNINIVNCKIKDFNIGLDSGGSDVALTNVHLYTDGGMTCTNGVGITQGAGYYCGAEANAPVADNSPNVTLDYPFDGWTVESLPVDFNFTVWDDWNVSNCSLWINTSGVWDLNSTMGDLFTNVSTQYNFTMSPAPGEHIWNVNCTDNSSQGAWYAAGNYSVIVNTTDAAPTVSALTFPADGLTLNVTAEPLDFNFTAFDNYMVDNCTLVTNLSGEWAVTASRSVGTNVSATYNISTVISQGELMWNVNCSDNVSNSSFFTTNYTVNFDEPAPYLELVSPDNATTIYSATFNLSFNVSDNYNVSNCSLWSNFSGSWGYNQTLDVNNKTVGTYNFSVSSGDGAFIWNVNCTDNASQSSWAENYSLTVDSVDSAPNVTLAYPANTTTITASSVGLKVQSYDDVNVSNCTLWTNFSGSWVANTTSNVSVGATTNTTFTVSPAYGTYFWNANCTDNASQSSLAVENLTFTLQQPSSSGGSTGGGGGGSSTDETEDEAPTIAITIPVAEDPVEEVVEEPVEEVVEEELFSPPTDEEKEAEKQAVVSRARRSKSDVVEVECNTDDCDEWFDDLIKKMDKTLDKVDLQKNVSFDEETNTTKVAISVVAEEDLDDFKYYQSIPKCMAIYAHLVKFKNTDFEVLKDDPLVVWSFANVRKGDELDLGFEVMGNIPENCHEFLAELLYEEQERFSFANMFGLVTGLGVLAVVALGITYSAKHSHHLAKMKGVTKLFKGKERKVSSEKVPTKVDKKLDLIKDRLKQL